MNRGAHAIAALSGEPGIAAAPAPRASPGLLPVAASRLVTGLSRASCRDASGLAVLMSTGRRAGLPGLSAAPAPPAGQGRVHHRPGPSDRHLLPPPAAANPAARSAALAARMTASRPGRVWGLVASQAAGRGGRVSAADVCAAAVAAIEVTGAWLSAAPGAEGGSPDAGD